MGERTDQIESHIKEERDELRANLGELRARVRSATDWRRQFRDNTLLGVGLAFGVGLLLGSVRRDSEREASPRWSGRSASGRGQLSKTWEAIESAFIGLAANRITGFLADIVPGLREHLTGAPHVSQSHRSGNGHGAWGEGNYEAARRYRAGAERYARTADVERAARAAEPRSESEAEELEAAEDLGRSRAKDS
ncbi:MAG TPA: hypothetical protein VKX16_14545 [Chloroflexota bacterium]|nr:hypothetical protein [Chloroflexota bacterium]